MMSILGKPKKYKRKISIAYLWGIGYPGGTAYPHSIAYPNSASFLADFMVK